MADYPRRMDQQGQRKARSRVLDPDRADVHAALHREADAVRGHSSIREAHAFLDELLDELLEVPSAET